MKTPVIIKYLVILSLNILLVSSIKAQADSPIWKFVRTTSVAEISLMLSDTLGNTYLAGTFDNESFRYGNDSVPGMSGTQTLNTFILKIDPTGRLVWLYSAHAEVIDIKIRPEKMAVSNRGELAIVLKAEYTNSVLLSDIPVPTDDRTETPIMAKISKTGIINWAYPLFSERDTLPKILVNDLFIDELGDVYTTGYFRGDSAHLDDRAISGFYDDEMLFVAKIDSRGEIDWFNNCPYNPDYDNANIRGTRLKNTRFDYFYLGGTHEGYKPFYFGIDSVFNSQSIDGFISRHSKTDGQAAWAQSFKGDSLDFIEDIVISDGNNVAVSGLYNSASLIIAGVDHLGISNAFNLVVANFTETGIYLNSDYYTTEIPDYTSGRKSAHLGTDANGNLILCSEFYAPSIFDGAYILPNSLPGTSDIMVAKIHSNTMTPIWTFQGTAPGDNFIEGAKIDNAGNVLLAGTSYESLLLGTETVVGNAVEGTPYLAKIQSDGIPDYVYWQTNTADGQVGVQKITGDGYGNSFVTGNYLGPASMIDDIDLTLTNVNGLFIGKYAYTKNLNGTVRNDDGDVINEGYVKLFGYTLYQRAPLNDSVWLESDGSFEFIDIPAGNYMVVANPTGTAAETYIPTYYPSVEYWEFAGHIRIRPDTDPNVLHIILQRISEFTGITEMSGNVSENDELKSIFNKSADKGKPTKKATVVLAGNKRQEKSTYQIVATTETDDEGNFAFYGIDDGMYYLWVDIPGLPCEPVYIIEVNGNQYISNLDYLVNEEVAEAEGFPQYSSIDSPFDDSGVVIFPIPANDAVTILLPLNEGIADIFDNNGNYVRRFELNQEENRIDITEFTPGNYTMRIYCNDSIIFKKFTIAR